MKRIECLRELAHLVEDSLVVAALGGTTDEWSQLRPSDANFYNVAMGSNLPLAMGLALALPHRRVVLIDTDGCQLMTLSALCTLANHPPSNLHVFVMDNESYAYTGGQPSATAGKSDLAAIARAAGIEGATCVVAIEEFRRAAERALLLGNELSYLVAKVRGESESRSSRGFDHVEAKYRFVRHIESLEGKEIMSKY